MYRHWRSVLAATEHLLLDAPVSGGASGAIEGTLVIMCSGSDVAFEAAHSVLAAMASRIYRFGNVPGAGSLLKMVNQLIVGVHTAVVAEAMALGARVGVNLPALVEIVSCGVGNSTMFALARR